MDELITFFNKVAGAIRDPRPKRVAAVTALAIQKDRIFSKGKAADGSQIGTYSTEPISISKSKQARQTGQTYFKGGYSEYKSKIGKNQGFVNLRNTDQMMGDFGVVVNGDEIGIGFQNDANGEKMSWMESKYGKDIAEQSDSEVNTFVNVLVDEQNKLY